MQTLRANVWSALGDGLQINYHDALFGKRNRVDLLLHEDLGGGFSPPAAHKIRRLGRKSREHEVDRTPYKGDRKISFVSYHTRRGLALARVSRIFFSNLGGGPF